MNIFLGGHHSFHHMCLLGECAMKHLQCFPAMKVTSEFNKACRAYDRLQEILRIEKEVK